MSIGKISEFHMGSGTWTCYAERLEMYFKVNKIEEDIKLPTLISVMGDEAYELLVNLASPKKPAALTYSEASELLRQHLQPTPSVLAERYRFRRSTQGPEQSVSDYVAELKRLARYCNFDNGLLENLRDQFVCGLRNDVVRQRLFAEDEVNFLTAVKIATSLEAAERDAAAVEARSVPEAPGDLHVMHARGARAGRARTLHAGAGGGGVPSRDHPCRGCGATGHGYENCRFRDYVCSRCKRRGHLRRVCSSVAGPRAQETTRGSRGFNYGAAADDGDAAPEVSIDLHSLCLRDYKPV